jgi:transcriptional regulator with XRE-family HTH domain
VAVPPTPPDVGRWVRELRRKQNLTVEELATRSGVSKSLISQIERNRTNPTLGTIWRLCTALGVSVQDVLGGSADRPSFAVVGAHATPVIRSLDGRCRLRILGPIDLGGLIEWYDFSAEPGGELVSAAHDPGTVEHLSVMEGTLSVESEGATMDVNADETARYRADCGHAIRNRGAVPARALMVVVLRRPVAG